MTRQTEFPIDHSIFNLISDYKFLDEFLVVVDFKGNIIASNKEIFIEFFSRFSRGRFNIFEIIDQNYHKTIHKRYAEMKKGKVTPPSEYKLKAADGPPAYVEVFSMPAIYHDQQAVVSLVRDITMKKEIEKKLLYAVIQTEDREWQKFAQDLHDELGPFLSALKLYLHELNTSDLSGPQKKKMIEYLVRMSDEAIEKIRNISGNLMPQNMIETGLVRSIENTISALNQEGKIKISLTTSGNEEGLADSLILTIYRMVLELINNSIKHSEANKVEISLNFRKTSVKLVFKDNGRGFDLKKVLQQKKGVGLQSIMNRVSFFQGNCIFTNHPGKGIGFEIILRQKL